MSNPFEQVNRWDKSYWQGVVNRSKHYKQPSPQSGPTWLRVYTKDPTHRLEFRARFGQTNVGVTGGGAGWKAVPRPKREPMTVWEGATDALTIALNLIFDGYTDPHGPVSVEYYLDVLDAMSGINKDGEQPPLLVLDAGGALQYDIHRYPHGLWVIGDTPEMGDSIRRDSDNDRVRQEVTVKFWKYVPGTDLTRAVKTSPTRTTIAKQGDTYEKIAARLLSAYGGRKLANRLAQFNGARDGAQAIQPGLVVKLPSTETVKTWATQPRR